MKMEDLFLYLTWEDDSSEHTSVLEEVLKDLMKEWADQFVHKSSRFCNSGWPCPAVSALHLGTDSLGCYHISIFSMRYLYFPVSAGIMANCSVNFLYITEH